MRKYAGIGYNKILNRIITRFPALTKEQTYALANQRWTHKLMSLLGDRQRRLIQRAEKLGDTAKVNSLRKGLTPSGRYIGGFGGLGIPENLDKADKYWSIFIHNDRVGVDTPAILYALEEGGGMRPFLRKALRGYSERVGSNTKYSTVSLPGFGPGKDPGKFSR